MKFVKNILVLMVALALSAQLSATSVVGGNTLGKIGKAFAVSAISLALAAAPLKFTDAQGGKTEADLTDVRADDYAYQGAMLLRVTIPPPMLPEEGDEAAEAAEAIEAAFHLAFIGVDGKGNSLLIGRERQSGVNVGDTLEKVAESSLYAWDGLVSSGLSIRRIDSFEDATGDGYYNVVLLQVEGLDLSTNYQPLAVSDSFPYMDERELEILAFRLFYHPHLDETELPGDSFTLRWMRCNSIPHHNLAIIGNGLTTCGIVDKDFSNGALIIHDNQLVALQSLNLPTMLDADGNPTAWLAIGLEERVVEYSLSLGEVAAAVEARGKLATTWGRLKKE